eukprot:GFUD01027705.1.p1 GENE.GFUD01027705.1~~GFUD01027705.1.p1  ORF type:complete len:610 (+),score=157.60 GFUD01027705.1:266-2095(+)
MALSPGDPNSYSRPDQVKTTHVHLHLEIDFEKKVLTGHALLTLEKVDPQVDVVILDARKLDIHSVSDEATGQVLEYEYGSPSGFGEKLEVKLPTSTSNEVKVKLSYTTSPQSSALQWLNPAQTAGKKHPYVFSQCEAIHARSMLPCQDTPSVKATYSATITAPADLTVLMSAIRDGEDQPGPDNKKVAKFTQKVPIQSYLIAIAAGAVESRKIGPRSHVWSEAEFVEKAAFDFSETETMLTAAEELCGPYVWGIYDILVLPPSFPFGGMENPCLTFATPTLLSGDKSNADVIAHEIAHSWTGNLVTNFNFEHFWLNEGFTVFTERKIIGRMHGEPSRHFSAILRWKDLQETVNVNLGPNNPLTALVPRLAGVDPDDAFSVVPYEKGSTFLWYLEDTVGGAVLFEPFLKSYYKKFAYQSIHSDTFKSYFLEYFSNVESVKTIDWDTWFNKPGMPIYKPNFDESLAQACWELAKKWQTWDISTPAPFDKEFESFSATQKQEFLGTLLNDSPLDHTKLEKMGAMYSLDSCSNVEIVFRWIRLGIKARWEPSLAEALKLATVQGRMKFVRPLFKDLYGWEEKRQQAIDTFKAHRGEMMYVCAEMVAKDLHITP